MSARRLVPLALIAAVAVAPAASAAVQVSVRPLTTAQRDAMTPSVWRKGCPVSLDQLRTVRATHKGYDGKDHTGTLVVNQAVASTVATALRRLYAAGVPIRKMRPIEAYGGNDWKSIEDDNTSAFNCRRATGSSNWSNHAYGRAIDINPIENPYVTSSGSVAHKASVTFVKRTAGPGVATPGSPMVKIFDNLGWGWGGTWSGTKDYQHFSSNGR
jgi:hypothetical protein